MSIINCIDDVPEIILSISARFQSNGRIDSFIFSSDGGKSSTNITAQFRKIHADDGLHTIAYACRLGVVNWLGRWTISLDRGSSWENDRCLGCMSHTIAEEGQWHSNNNNESCPDTIVQPNQLEFAFELPTTRFQLKSSFSFSCISNCN